MGIVALLSGCTMILLGILIWKLKLVEILAGYKSSEAIDKNILSIASGLSLLLVGVLLLVESTLIFSNILINDKGVFVVVGTIIIGIIIVGIITAHYSKS